MAKRGRPKKQPITEEEKKKAIKKEQLAFSWNNFNANLPNDLKLLNDVIENDPELKDKGITAKNLLANDRDVYNNKLNILYDKYFEPTKYLNNKNYQIDRVETDEEQANNPAYKQLSTTTEKYDKDLLYWLRSIGGNTTANVISAPPEFAGLLWGLTKYPFKKAKALYDGDYDRPVFAESLDNVFTNAGLALEDYVRDEVGINKPEDMDRAEQLLNIGTMLVGVGTAPAKLTTKASVANKITKAGKDLITTSLAPGLQITKEASLPIKATQATIQAGIPIGMNDYARSLAGEPGILKDYSKTVEPQQETEYDILANRKNATNDKIYLGEFHTDDPTLKNDEEKTPLWKKTLIGGATLLGGATAVRHSKLAQNLIQKHKNNIIQKQNNDVFNKTLTTTDKIVGTVDRNYIADNAANKGFITKETAQEVRRNTKLQANNFFDTGVLYVNNDLIQLERSPRTIISEFEALKKQKPMEGKLVDQFFDTNSKIQHAVYEYNELNHTNYSVIDLIKNDLSKNIKIDDGRTITDALVYSQKLYNYINNKSSFKKVLQDISKINDTVLDLAVMTKQMSPEFAQSLKIHRTFFGLNTYLPRIPKQEKTFTEYLWSKAFPTLYKDKVYDTNDIFTFGRRSINGTYDETATWEKTFIPNFVNSVEDLLNKNVTRSIINDLINTRDAKVKSSINVINDINSINKESNKLISTVPYEHKAEKQFDNIKHIATIDNTDNLNTKTDLNVNPLNKILNKTTEEMSGSEIRINNKVMGTGSEANDALRTAATDPSIIALPYDNKIELYKVDPWLGKIVHNNPKDASIIYNTLLNTTNLMKKYVTGNMNRFFSVITGTYTLTDILTGLPSINKELNTKFSRTKTLINTIKGYGQSFGYKRTANKLNYLTEGIKNGYVKNNKTNLDKIKALETKLQNNPITHYKASGANIQTRYPITIDKTYKNYENANEFIINSKKTLDKLKNLAFNNSVVHNPVTHGVSTVFDYVTYALDALRDAPTLGLYKTLSPKFMTNGKIDPKKIMDVSKVISKKTATGNIKPTASVGGNLVKSFTDVIPYSGDALSENVARLHQSGIRKAPKNLLNLFDANVPISKAIKDLNPLDNDFVKSGLSLITAPVVIASIWNHSSPENEAAYDALPDNTKNKGIVFVNGVNNSPLVIPMTQSLMWLITGVRDGIVDPQVRLDRNKVNPADNLNHRLFETANINFGLSMPPSVGLGFNALGIKAPNMLELGLDAINKQHPLDSYKINSLDYDTGTYKKEGVFTPKQKAFAQTLFGNVGNAVTETIDTYASSKNITNALGTGWNTYATSFLNLLNPKANTWNKTSEVLYEKEGLYKSARGKIVTGNDWNIKNVIDMFYNSRIKQINEKVKEIRKQIREIKQTSKSSNSDKLSYTERQNLINKYTRHINALQGYKYDEYEKLDNFLKSNYNTTHDEFLKGLK